MIKRAYILAKQKEDFKPLAGRVRTIFFLATPHQGAGLAQTLSLFLKLTPGARPFVKDLHRDSLEIQSINDEFPHHSEHLQLVSFYESLPIFGQSLVVDKESATMGYANERAECLNADHRNVCKFAAQTDPNYRTIRNAMAFTIDSFRSHVHFSSPQCNDEQYRLLDSFLGVTEAPENEYMDADALRLRGSCEWLIRKESFHNWRDSASTHLYWISAKPGTGKTVLSGRVVSHLKDQRHDLAFYFFDYRDKAKTTINSFLLSMAWQMARLHPGLLEDILEACEKFDQIYKADYRTIWRKLFLERILRFKIIKPQFWVIDALDECKHEAELVPLLLKIIETCSIRILLTSRDTFQSHRQPLHYGIQVSSEEVKDQDTESDIKLYLDAHMDQLPSIDHENRQKMVTSILEKSAGCFLWVSLILQELQLVHTSAEIRQVLDEIPSDMDELYLRILNSMSRATYGKKLAKAILTWTVCSVRPLKTHELYHALQLDMKDTIDSMERSITSSCGQLVYIDAQSQVQMVHQTARDFLLNVDSTDSEFAVDAKTGHKRLIMTCLLYLNGDEMKGPRHRRLSAARSSKEHCPFVVYACSSFFEHIAYVSPTDDDFLMAMGKLLKSSNVLSWIQYMAQNFNLNRLIRAGKSLRHYLQRRSKYLSPFGEEVSILDSWATDLIRLITKFGKNLSNSPKSVFHLIPSFCPPDSAPHKQFASSTRGIGVVGLSATSWDDCLSTITNFDEQFTALASSDKYFAIGMSRGRIAVHSEMTCQEVRQLQHHEGVRILKFCPKMDTLASAGLQVIRIWSTVSWQQVSEFHITHPCLSLSFVEEQQLLLAALKDNCLMIWDLATESLRDSSNWTKELEGRHAHAFRRPIAAAFCVESYLLAVVYRGQDLLLWDLERDTLHETYCKETGARSQEQKRRTTAGATGLIFGVASSIGLLVASYSDGDLVLFDTSKGDVIATTLANAHILACSPDGRTLATGNSSGIIQVFDFETLKLLYRIQSEDDGIRELAFSGDSHRLTDIRGSQCRVWDPPVLVRQDVEEDHTDTASISTISPEINTGVSDDVVRITSLACPKKDKYMFCGKENGSVYVYEINSGRQVERLFGHAEGVSILSLQFEDKSQTIISVDSSSRIRVHNLFLEKHGWTARAAFFDHRVGIAVTQVLINSDNTRLLVSTVKCDTLWLLSSNASTVIQSLSWRDRESYRWAAHPHTPGQLILIADTTAHMYDWGTLHRLTGESGILLEGSILPELSIQSMVPCNAGSVIATAFNRPSRSDSQAKLLLWDTSDFYAESRSAIPVPKYRTLAEHVKNVIGEFGQRLVFLHNSNWICSADLESPNPDDYTCHFFLPADWLSTNIDLIFGITNNGEIIFVKRHEIAVIKRGLSSSEQGHDVSPTRLSLSRGRKPALKGPEDRLSVPSQDSV